jgi:hypothetical protein
METLETAGNQKLCSKFYCEKCDYITNKKSSYESHLLSSKHKKAYLETKFCSLHECNICGRSYNNRSGLWKHKKQCSKSIQAYPCIDVSNNSVSIDKEILLEFLKQNQEFKQFILEQNKQMLELSKMSSINNCNNTNTNNSHNKFNLQFFLNNKCKDALNITDFVDSLKISLTDFENVGSQGFIEGISNIMIKGLKQLDVTKRPIHCSDLKREVMHIKHNNVWEKENEENKPHLTSAIQKIADKNIKMIPAWTEANPKCFDISSKKNDQYMKILYEAMGADNKQQDIKNYNKIIQKVAKEIIIQKEIE